MTTMTGEGLADNFPRLVERSSGCCPSLAHLTRPSQIQPRRPKSKPMANDRQTEFSAPALVGTSQLSHLSLRYLKRVQAIEGTDASLLGAAILLVKTPGNHREQPTEGANRWKK